MMRWLASTLIHRAPRERTLLALLVFAALPIAFAALVILPLQDRISAQSTQLTEARAQLDWLTDAARSYVPPAAGEAQTPTDTQQPITSAADLERTLAAAGLQDKVSRLSAQGRNRISLGFDEVAFQDAMTWLSDLTAAGLRITELRLARTEAPGLVRLDLTLEPGV